MQGTAAAAAAFNKSWKRHPTKQQLHDYLSSITQAILVRPARHAKHCW